MNPTRKCILIVLAFILPIIAYTQTERWVYKSARGGGASCLCYGADGNLYAGGHTCNDSTNCDFTIISLTNSGSERWVYTYPTLGNNCDECHSICYGNDDNIYAVGNSTGSDSVFHFTIISLTTDGTERWIYQYQDTSNANAICYGADGNIYAVGSTQRKILVVSVDTMGSERWCYIYPNPSSEGDPGMSIVYGFDGNIYVTGHSGPTDTTDVTVISLTPSGSERWVYLYNGPANYYDFGNCITYAPDGNLYIFGSTCYLEPPGYFYWDALVISLSNSGNERWTYIGSRLTWFSQGIYGADGNLYIAGDLGWDIFYPRIESISNSGTYRWQYTDSTWGWTSSIAYGGDGNIYVGGKTSTFFLPESSYFTVMKFASDGELLWTYQYNPPHTDWSVSANAVVYGLDGNIYAAGVTWDSLTGADFTVLSLNPTGIEEGERLKVKDGRLKLNVLPNIISDNALLRYTIPEKQRICLKLYDIVGREVMVIANRIVDAGIHSYNLNTSKFGSGIYFLILEGEKEIKSERMLIVK